MMVRRPKLSKLFSVTPNHFVRTDPISVPTIPPPLKILIRVAKSTASTPGRQRRAAKTSVGRNTNTPSGIPSERLACVMSSNVDNPNGVEAIDAQNKMSLIGTY